MTYAMKYDAPVGPLTILSDGESITQVLFANQACSDEMIQTGNVPILQQAEAWLDCYFSGENATFPLRRKTILNRGENSAYAYAYNILLSHIPDHGMSFSDIKKKSEYNVLPAF